MWKLIQGLIFFSVMASNIHWQWTPNPYAVAFCGWFLALMVTGLLSRLLWLRPHQFLNHHQTTLGSHISGFSEKLISQISLNRTRHK